MAKEDQPISNNYDMVIDIVDTFSSMFHIYVNLGDDLFEESSSRDRADNANELCTWDSGAEIMIRCSA